MFEKIISFIADNLKYSFIIGSLGSFVVYLSERALNKQRTQVWGFNFIIMVIQLFIGGVVAYFVGTLLAPDAINRDALLGIAGAGSYPVFKFLEANGNSILNKLADKIKDKI